MTTTGSTTRASGRPLPPSQILVMTFTVAATRELPNAYPGTTAAVPMRGFRGDGVEVAEDRTRSSTTLLAVLSRPVARATLAAFRLATAADAMDDAAGVFTIDAMDRQRMLREHAFDSGSLFDEEVQPDEERMLTDAARDYWRQQVYPLDARALAGRSGRVGRSRRAREGRAAAEALRAEHAGRPAVARGRVGRFDVAPRCGARRRQGRMD